MDHRPLGAALAAFIVVCLFLPPASAADGSSLVLDRSRPNIALGSILPKGVKLSRGEGLLKRFRIGSVDFPQGIVPVRNQRQYLGTSKVRIRVRRQEVAPKGADYVVASFAGIGYSRIGIWRRKEGPCEHAVWWISSDVVFGRQRGVECDNVIEVRTTDWIPNIAIGNGERRNWDLKLESLSKPVVDSAWFSPSSRIEFTKKTPAWLNIRIPKRISGEESSTPSIPIRIQNKGGRKATNVKVWSAVQIDPIRLSNRKEVPVQDIAARSTVPAEVPVALLRKGRYRLLIGVESKTVRDEKLLIYRVDGEIEGDQQSSSASFGLIGIGLLALIGSFGLWRSGTRQDQER